MFAGARLDGSASAASSASSSRASWRSVSAMTMSFFVLTWRYTAALEKPSASPTSAARFADSVLRYQVVSGGKDSSLRGTARYVSKPAGHRGCRNHIGEASRSAVDRRLPTATLWLPIGNPH